MKPTDPSLEVWLNALNELVFEAELAALMASVDAEKAPPRGDKLTLVPSPDDL